MATATCNVAQNGWPMVYFISFNILCVSVANNVVVSIILETFDKVAEQVENEEDVLKERQRKLVEAGGDASTLGADDAAFNELELSCGAM